MQDTGYYLGIDGGQSHTTAIIAAEDGTIVGRGVSGPSNHTREPGGRERLERAVSESVSDALREAGLMERGSIDDFLFRSAYLAMTGEPEYKIDIVGQLISAEHLIVDHDAPGALSGALAGKDGVIVLSGTGSVAYGEIHIGKSLRRVRIGGIGYLFGDEGSGFWIGKEALRRVIHQEDRLSVEDPQFEAALLTHFKRNEVRAIAEDYYAGVISRDQLASFASRVDRLAKRGNETATGMLAEAAEDLAELVQATVVNLGGTRRQILVSYGGGVFNSRILLRGFTARLKELAPRTRVRRPQFGPDIGALLLAYREAGIKLTPELLANLG